MKSMKSKNTSDLPVPDLYDQFMRIHNWNVQHLKPGYSPLGQPALGTFPDDPIFVEQCIPITDEEGIALYGFPSYQVPYTLVDQVLNHYLNIPNHE